MAVIKPRKIDTKEKGKKAKYSEGAVPESSKLSGVNRTFLLGALPYSQENYENVKILLGQLDMSELKPTFSADIKMYIYILGKVYSTCKYPCIFGSGHSPWTEDCELLTVGDARRLWAEYLAAGGKGTGQETGSFVNEILVQYPDETFLLDCLNFPELHVMLGLVKKLLDYIQLASSTSFVEDVIKALNLTFTFHRGEKGLNGNACRKLLENTDVITNMSHLLPDSCDKVKIAAAVKTLSLFNNVVSTSFGVLVKEGWVQNIQDFCASYRALPMISFPPKYHLVEGHLEQFLRRRWSQDSSYEGFGLGYWSEQPFEALHHKFEEHLERYKVGKMHESYGERLLDAVLTWNTRRM